MAMAMTIGERRRRLRWRAYLVLDQELNTFDGGSSGLRDGGGDTTHCRRELLVALSSEV